MNLAIERLWPLGLLLAVGLSMDHPFGAMR